MSDVMKSTSVLAAPRASTTSAPSTYARTGAVDMAPPYTPAQMVPPSSIAVLPWRVVATGRPTSRASLRTPAWALRRWTSTPTRRTGRFARLRAETTSVTAQSQAWGSCGRLRSHRVTGVAAARASASPVGHGACATSMGTSMRTGRLSRTQVRSASSMSPGALSESRSTTVAAVTGEKAACCASKLDPRAWCGSVSGVE
mmetsp:Transcript_23034/g.62533  ORF Transcript_23034/g.62533 Transcript_23034/m.62533 type:complete len:200 (-) Transcript_23034:400-999(-)